MKWLAYFYGLFIVIIIVLADTRKLGFLYAFYDFPFGDKIGHLFIFGLLSLVVNLSVLSIKSLANNPIYMELSIKRVVIKTSFVLAVFVGLEEFSQRWFASRTADLVDLSASYVGIAVFAFLALKIMNKRSRSL